MSRDAQRRGPHARGRSGIHLKSPSTGQVDSPTADLQRGRGEQAGHDVVQVGDAVDAAAST